MAVEDFLIRPTDTLRQAALTIDANLSGIAVVVDEAGRLIGTVTDGDLRRASLRDVPLDSSVADLLAARRGTRYAKPLSAPVGTSTEELLELMRARSVRQLPIVDDQERVTDIAVLDRLVGSPSLPVTAVVMAGGLGTRLRPLTEDVPKPLLPIGGRPLIDTVLGQLKRSGIHQIVVTTHYRAEQISNHLGNGADHGVQIDYQHETTPLGTAGVLGKLSHTDKPLLVINGDVLTTLDFAALVAFHIEHEADMTVAVREYSIRVPFGVVEAEDGRVRAVREKPEYKFFVLAGVYLIAPHVVRTIGSGEHCDMPELIRRQLEAGGRVESFPVREYWLDIGRLEDYERAQLDFATQRFE